jgi:hypothetical protein
MDPQDVAFAEELEREPDADELDWMRERRAWLHSLPPQRHADELNECSDLVPVSSRTTWIVVAGQVVSEGGEVHRELVRQERALAWRRGRLAGIRIARTLIRVGTRGRERRDHRATLRRTSARSPDPEPEPARPLEAAA